MKKPAAVLKKPAAVLKKPAQKKNDDKKKAEDKSDKNDDKKAEASVQASQWEVPAQRPSWARATDGGEASRHGQVTVSQLEEDTWICDVGIDLNSSVASPWAHHYFVAFSSNTCFAFGGT